MRLERICQRCLGYMLDNELVGWLKCQACSFMKKKGISMITMQEVLMGRVKFEDLSEELQTNGNELVKRLNLFRAEYGHPMYVSSGYRSAEINAKDGGSKTSAHLTLQACDFVDTDGKLFEFIKKDPKILERCDLYMEDAQWSPNWIHLQSRKASKRIFIPSNTSAKDESRKIEEDQS